MDDIDRCRFVLLCRRHAGVGRLQLRCAGRDVRAVVRPDLCRSGLLRPELRDDLRFELRFELRLELLPPSQVLQTQVLPHSLLQAQVLQTQVLP
ncbi:MAG: hypothetical protein EXS05_12025 [Planctomycetaceae bacterium]|nr:hypothetical protein [Planctomycetaceae bacterium]